MSSATKLGTAAHKIGVFYMTNMQKLHRGIWPWTAGLKSRLPMHYKVRYVENWMRKPAPVHYRPDTRKYEADEFGVPQPVQNVPIPVIYPKQADEGLWGGEGIISGLKKRGLRIHPVHLPHIWKPRLLSRVFYSEILDRWMEIVVTIRTMDMIDEAQGFDRYILKTHEIDLKSRLGMKLKREMLLTLARQSMYPNDKTKREDISEKYKEFVIPEEQAEWVGLTLYEAERKQNEIEEEERKKSTKPLKMRYFDSLSSELSKDVSDTAVEESGISSWMKKLSPFQDKQNKE